MPNPDSKNPRVYSQSIKGPVSNEKFYLPRVEKFALSTAADTSAPGRQTAWNLKWILYFECLLPWQVRKFYIKPAKLPGGGTA